jgi:hypothetical protein
VEFDTISFKSFRLPLETIYGAFDVLAKKRRVSPETGDCHVAVAGLLTQCKEHDVVIMARLASDCRQLEIDYAEA